MACGTPVIAFRNGSVPEVLDDGITGFIVESVPQAIEAISKLDQLSRIKIRQVFEEKFTATRMAKDYVRLYQSVINRKELFSKGTVRIYKKQHYASGFSDPYRRK